MVCPLAGIASAILVGIFVEESYLVYPYLTFISVTEAGIFISYMMYYRKNFDKDYEYWVTQGKALNARDDIKVRSKQKLLVGNCKTPSEA